MGVNTSRPSDISAKPQGRQSIRRPKSNFKASLRQKLKPGPNGGQRQQKHIQTNRTEHAAELSTQMKNLTISSDTKNSGQVLKPAKLPNTSSFPNGENKKTHIVSKPPSPSTSDSQISQQANQTSLAVPNASPTKHPIIIERFKISSDLITRLQKVPQFTSIPFGILGLKQTNKINSALITPLPFLPPLASQQQTSWSTIQQALDNVASLCQQGYKPVDILYTTISKFNSTLQNESNFGMLNRPDVEAMLQVTLPYIAEQALELAQLLRQPIPYLSNGESRTIFLNRKLCCSLLANAFFCTYYPHKLNDMPDINFYRLFNDTNSDRCEVKKEKLKCILNYFNIMHQTAANLKFQQQIISFERRCMDKKTVWENDNHKLCKVFIEPDKKIEQADRMLQVDFANRLVGGGVLNNGSVMEEIRFSTCPELIVSRLFTQALDHDEVLVVTGTETFSTYTGYSTSFTFNGPTNIQWGQQPVDRFGRTYTQLVTMDATYFKRNEFAKQFRKQYIDRDLHKCKVAFQHGKAAISPIATGNWGCGAFNGNTELKFMIQWMAASHQDRPMMLYHITGNTVQGQSLLDMSSFLILRNICVGKLYQVVLDYSTEVLEKDLGYETTLFPYVKHRLSK